MAGQQANAWECDVCGYVYDEAKEGVPWDELPDDWECPTCGATKSEFSPQAAAAPAPEAQASAAPPDASASDWVRVAGPGELVDGQVVPVTAGERTIALSLVDGEYGAIDNTCPHQGGPLSEGTLDDDGRLRCPWHGWGF